MEDDPITDDPPRSIAARFGAWFQASPVELAGLSILLLGAILVTALVVVDAWRRPSGPTPAASVGAAVETWPDGEAGEDTGHGAHGGGHGSGDDAEPGAEAPSDAAVVVHVSGAVHDAGVVTLAGGARVMDAIVAAGGATDVADTDRLNLAREVADGEQVHVPAEGEEAPIPEERTGGGDEADGVLDLNRASQAELETLPGIGPAKASAIIEHRESVGPFEVAGDLRAVPGIGEATFQRLAELVTVR